MDTIDMRIEYDDREVIAAMTRALYASNNPETFLDPIGSTLANSTRLRFDSGSGPDGTAWAAVLRGGKPLRDTSTHLLGSINYRVQVNRLDVGVAPAWASVHQFGKVIKAKEAPYLRFKVGDRWSRKKEVTIPARPFLGITDDDKKEMTRILQETVTP